MFTLCNTMINCMINVMIVTKKSSYQAVEIDVLDSAPVATMRLLD